MCYKGLYKNKSRSSIICDDNAVRSFVDSFCFITQAPMRVFVPYCQTDSDDEIVVKCSVDGQDWVEREPVYQSSVSREFKVKSIYSKPLVCMTMSCHNQNWHF